MLRYFKYTMETIDGVAIFLIISLILFFTFSLGVLFLVLRTDKKYFDHAGNLPLDDEDKTIKNALP
ncbi:MAG: CcoQ/FixQ family Cbb3-type cytochrome c oxidase assembly chaperone [Bacteroidales bacterium]|nr:CcoQ/FixQ family Cbb3-type cytochrome c oxidase assembly chaperone [Bacteroidales bacterium]